MRDQGRLVEWFDDKGYGFIQPQDSHKDRVFLHIKDFAHTGPRPIVGCAVEYTVLLDERGRYHAQQVIYLKASQVLEHRADKAKPATFKRWSAMQIGIVLYIGFMLIASFSKLLPPYTLLFVSLMNGLSYWLYGLDKEAAQLGNKRVPEQSLHVVDALGGWCGGWLAQQKLCHKTQKQAFQKIYYCTIGLHILLIAWLISPLNVFY